MSDQLSVFGGQPVRCGCGGEAKVAFCQQSYCGQNCFGDKKIKYRVYMICKKCHARGKPIITDWLINPHPWDSIYSGRIRHNAEQDEMFAPYVERAIEAWNRAMGAKDINVMDKFAKDINVPRKGKWQRRKGSDCWECSECHAVLESDDIVRHNYYYCYHCGADMMSEDGYMKLEGTEHE